jgi:hypothetical protein
MFIMHYLAPVPIDLPDVARVARAAGLRAEEHESGPFRSLQITFTTGLSWYWEPVPKEFWKPGELDDDEVALVASVRPARIFAIRMNPVPRSELHPFLADLLGRHGGFLTLGDGRQFTRESLTSLIAYLDHVSQQGV